MLLLVAAAAGGAARSDQTMDFGYPPNIRSPSSGDVHISNASELRQHIAAASLQPNTPLSLHLNNSVFELGDSLGPIEINNNLGVTLWGDTQDAVLDAQGSSAVFRIKSGGSLLLQGVSVTGGFTEDLGGGCIRIDRTGLDLNSWLMLDHVRVYNCTTRSGDGGGLNVFGGDVRIRDSVFEDNRALSDTGDNARGGAVGVQDGQVQMSNVRFVRSLVKAQSGQSYGGGVAVWGTAQLIMDDVEFRDCSASSPSSAQSFGGGLGASGGSTQMSNTRFVRSVVNSAEGVCFGGGIGIEVGQVVMERVAFTDCSVFSTLSDAGGGGLGALGGVTTMTDARFENTVAASNGSRALGGGLGMLYSAQVKMTDTTLIGTHTIAGTSTAAAVGGGISIVGQQGGAVPLLDADGLTLQNVSIVDAFILAPNRSTARGTAISSGVQGRVVATFLSVHQTCELADMVSVIDGQGEKMALRELELNLTECESVIEPREILITCEDDAAMRLPAWLPSVCGTGADCKMRELSIIRPRCFALSPAIAP